jgi:outer membrane protein OmpA-like peptidoglycan-associated protein
LAKERVLRLLSTVPGLAMALVLVAGCATKEWVQELIAQRDTRIDQKVAGVEAVASQTQQNLDRARLSADRAQQGAGQAQLNADQIQRRMEAIDRRVGTLESNAATVAKRTEGAWTRAEGASTRAEEVDARLSRLWARRNTGTVVNILEVQFGSNQASLDDTGKSMLLAVVREVRQNPELTLDLEGYTDSTGSHRQNVRLAQRRVETVRRYLIEEGVEHHRIKASARGPVEDARVPEARKRRVDVKLVVAPD